MLMLSYSLKLAEPKNAVENQRHGKSYKTKFLDDAEYDLG